jgi:exopolysaccharide biosynthesis predicted pyruvyltransferase EpsI
MMTSTDTTREIAESRLGLIGRLSDRIHDCLAPYILPELPLAIVDFPDIRNCGDSAIWLGEVAYLKQRFNKRADYVSRIVDFSAEELKRRVPEGPVFIHGGGNFGDIWVAHQDFREAILERFPNRQIIQLPQSIHYDSPQRVEQSARVIGRHRNFVLLVRDEQSRQFAETHFDCEVKLCPDMAFAIGPLGPRPSQFPVLAMLREDAEKVGSVDRSVLSDIPTEDWITESRHKVRIAKALGAASAVLSLQPDEIALRKLDAAANNRFERGIAQIARGAAIVTDRLHVHICSLLLGRPHAVLDNSYGKIRRFMDAFSGGTALSYRASSLADGIAWARHQAEQAAAA